MKEQKQTIGSEANKLAERYYKIYQSLSMRFSEEKAKNLAKHDLILQKLVAEFALEELDKKIKEFCPNCQGENAKTGYVEEWDGLCPECGRKIKEVE